MAKPLHIGFIGAGRLATTLAMVWDAAGESIVGASSRSQSSAAALAARCRNARAFDTAAGLAAAADLVFITVPDDAIAAVVDAMTWRPDQHVVHCSAACEVAVLNHAAQNGAQTGGFHPLQIFSDPDVARHHVAGSAVAIEAAGALQQELERLAAIAGMKALSLRPGSRMAYHLAGNLAASCLLALLAEAEDLWAECGLDSDAALAALLPLSLGTLDAARRLGLAKAVSGPASRGDSMILSRHLALAQQRPAGAGLYRELLTRLLTLTEKSGRVDTARLEELRQLLAGTR